MTPALSTCSKIERACVLLLGVSIIASTGAVQAQGHGPATATAINASSALVSWAPPLSTRRVKIFRDSKLRDSISVPTGAVAYEDHLLWPSTTYTYKLEAIGSGGTSLATSTVSLKTPTQSGSFPRMYGPTSFFNQPIPADPSLASNSDEMVTRALARYASNANFANSNDWGIALAYANGASRKFQIRCTRYDCDKSVSFRVPRYARPTKGSDHHLAVVDSSSNEELDMWLANKSRGRWSAGSRFITTADGWGAICALREHCNGAVAAGFSLMGGVIRPEEIAQGRIDHALVFTTPFTRKGTIACPATHTDGKYDDPGAIPEGARIQLNPSFDVNATSWPRWQKVIATALQEYGAYLVDTGGSLAIRGEATLNRGYNAWSRAGVPSDAPSLRDLPWGQFRVLAFDNC